jgi:hypothetical protein
MKKIRNVLYRYRLITSMLALVLLLAALVVTPAQAEIAPIEDMNCSGSCINWTQQDGCKKCLYCCSYSDGSWWCKEEPGYNCW